jgi:hypothetical protein
MIKLIENIFTLMSVTVIWVITANYLSTPNSAIVSFILCAFSIITPTLWVTSRMKVRKRSSNFPFFWRNLK